MDAIEALPGHRSQPPSSLGGDGVGLDLDGGAVEAAQGFEGGVVVSGRHPIATVERERDLASEPFQAVFRRMAPTTSPPAHRRPTISP